METAQDRLIRQVFPSLVPRFLAITALATALAWGHVQVRPRILELISGADLQWLYVTVTSTVLITMALVGIIGSVVGYFGYLRNRQRHTSLSEAGLALRSVLAALAGLVALGAVCAVNSAW